MLGIVPTHYSLSSRCSALHICDHILISISIGSDFSCRFVWVILNGCRFWDSPTNRANLTCCGTAGKCDHTVSITYLGLLLYYPNARGHFFPALKCHPVISFPLLLPSQSTAMAKFSQHNVPPPIANGSTELNPKKGYVPLNEEGGCHKPERPAWKVSPCHPGQDM